MTTRFTNVEFRRGKLNFYSSGYKCAFCNACDFVQEFAGEEGKTGILFFAVDSKFDIGVAFPMHDDMVALNVCLECQRATDLHARIAERVEGLRQNADMLDSLVLPETWP